MDRHIENTGGNEMHLHYHRPLYCTRTKVSAWESETKIASLSLNVFLSTGNLINMFINCRILCVCVCVCVCMCVCVEGQMT
jgi:hypothetical protein